MLWCARAHPLTHTPPPPPQHSQTPHSTFGYVSHGYGSLTPFKVQNEPHVRCDRWSASEPHSHFWGPLFREKAHRPAIASTYCMPDHPLGFQMEGPPRWG